MRFSLGSLVLALTLPALSSPASAVCDPFTGGAPDFVECEREEVEDQVDPPTWSEILQAIETIQDLVVSNAWCVNGNNHEMCKYMLCTPQSMIPYCDQYVMSQWRYVKGFTPRYFSGGTTCPVYTNTAIACQTHSVYYDRDRLAVQDCVWAAVLVTSEPPRIVSTGLLCTQRADVLIP